MRGKESPSHALDAERETPTAAARPKRETLDLRGVSCPLSWAKTRVRLEELRRGDQLVVLLDDPKSVRDIPRAAEAEGYAAGEPVAEAGCWTLVLFP